ncbi:hypothetical protein DXG01_006151, partial [Tephrocybe rancida]
GPRINGVPEYVEPNARLDNIRSRSSVRNQGAGNRRRASTGKTHARLLGSTGLPVATFPAPRRRVSGHLLEFEDAWLMRRGRGHGPWAGKGGQEDEGVAEWDKYSVVGDPGVSKDLIGGEVSKGVISGKIGSIAEPHRTLMFIT